MTRSLLLQIGFLTLMVVAFVALSRVNPLTDATVSQITSTTTSETASVAAPSLLATSSLATTTPKAKKPTAPVVKKEVSTDQAMRIANPYPFPPQSFSTINEAARGALVNILCMPRSGSLRPISGSGVLIDPRGVILTNAHVAQYVLLSQSSRIDLSCTIRTGAPASARWVPEVLYIPPAWVKAHAQEINDQRPLGTGEHDYALLLITRSVDGSPLPTTFPSLPFDTREAIGFQGDSVLAASYPAEFLGGIAAQSSLYPVSSVTTIKQLLTFNTGTVDLISLGGIIEAQSGSSGGAVVNAWGRLIGIIATTSEGDTTALRDLRAVTLSYISHDLAAQTQFDLATTLGGDVFAEAQDFSIHTAPDLIKLFIAQLTHYFL